MSANAKFVVFLVVSGLVATTAYFFFPEVEAADLELALAIAFASTLTQLGAVWYFLSSLQTFKPALRRAYYLLAGGVFLFSWTQLLPSLSVFIEITSDTNILNLLFVTPYVLGALLIYLGIRKFARLLDATYVWNSFLLVLGLSAVALGGFAWLSQMRYTEYDVTLHFIIGTVGWGGVCSAAAMLVALRIRRVIGEVYKPAITWTAAALGMLAFTSFHEIIVKTYFIDSWYVAHSLSLWPYLIVGILMLRAGLAFNETSRQFVELPASASYVDVVVGVAQMVSNQSAVDSTLDDVRVITAKHSKDSLSEADKATLIRVYVSIENYLITKEPLQKFTKESLRGSLPADFVKALPA